MEDPSPAAPQQGFVHAGVGKPPSKKEDADLQGFTLIRKTCCCENSMETSLTTTMGSTYQGDSRVTPYGKVIGGS